MSWGLGAGVVLWGWAHRGAEAVWPNIPSRSAAARRAVASQPTTVRIGPLGSFEDSWDGVIIMALAFCSKNAAWALLAPRGGLPRPRLLRVVLSAPYAPPKTGRTTLWM